MAIELLGHFAHRTGAAWLTRLLDGDRARHSDAPRLPDLVVAALRHAQEESGQ